MKSFLLIFIFASIGFAQNYPHFVLVDKNGQRTEGKNGSFVEGVFYGKTNDNYEFSIPNDQINKLYVAKSSKIVPIGALGFLAGTVIGLSVDYNYATSSFGGNAGLILAFSVAGMLIGGIVGSSSYYWETLDFNLINTQLPDKNTSMMHLQIRLKL